jgi:magnesium transporter
VQIPEDAKPTEMRVLAYGPEGNAEEPIDRIEEVDAFREQWPTTWVTLTGYGSENTLAALTAHFRLHRLVLEDVVNGAQRAKLEKYPDHVFLVARIPVGSGGRTEQTSWILSDNCLINLVREGDDWLEPVRNRIREQIGRIHRAGVDYLLYAVLDTLVDSYYPIIEKLGERLDKLETEVLRAPTATTMHRIHGTKRTLLRLRRAIWPHRELINTLLRDAEFVTEETKLHLRDCYDHLMRLTELIETLREVCSDLMGTYLSSLSNKMNEVMKVLTIIATIFIPITFIAGIYGMNFERMPELGWGWGYFGALGAMGTVAAIMVFFFWRRDWFD